MDFFATGGFQKLFQELHASECMDFHILERSDFEVLEKCDSTLDLYNNEENDRRQRHYYYEDHDYCELHNVVMNDVAVTTATLKLDILHKHWDEDYENNRSNHTSDHTDLNNNHDRLLHENQLQKSLNSVLQDTAAAAAATAAAASDEMDADADPESDTTCDALITHREISDWEEKFLDNYIEIPELIDILPERTPLCTETCDHFLHESSKHLKLNRKLRHALDGVFDKGGYQCTFGTCAKIYAKPAHLKAHLRRHLGEKPYVCNWPECTWKFSRSDELARHRRSHSGVKPYKCDYCTKCFARSDHLTKHRKVHERRMLAAEKAGKAVDGILPHSVFTVRPGRKRKNQIC